MDYQSIIDKYYPEDNELKRLLMHHSRQVADRCLKIAKQHPELRLDTEFLEEAAMLHDIGIFRCNSTGYALPCCTIIRRLHNDFLQKVAVVIFHLEAD